MRRALARWLEGPFWALALKELRQIRRDRRLALSLVIPPTLQVVLFGLALDSEVRNLQLGVVDQSRTAESRALVSMLTENRTFRLAGYYVSPAELGDALSRGRLDVGVVVRDALLQGGGWPAVWWAVLAIGAIGLVFYALAWRTMRHMQLKA